VTGEAEDRSAGVVRAAGGVVVDAQGRVAIVHRPRYDDWSLPKGKLLDGEDALAGALREVEEETGLRCVPVRQIGRLRYLDQRRRQKVVDYWLMEPTDGAFSPNAEVDEIRWIAAEAAEVSLTFPHDVDILRKGLQAWADPRT